jgi:LacI family transcriptional regulator
MDKIDLKALSVRLNLSISTISKALHDSHEVKETTKKRVRELAGQLNYRPNPFASNLRKQSSQTIAVVIPKIINNFFTVVLDGIESVASKKGFHVLIYITHDSYVNECAALKYLECGRVDGAIISISSETSSYEHILSLKNNTKSIAFFDRTVEMEDCPNISIDNYESSFQATEILINKKCKKIAYLSIPHDNSMGCKRKQGFLDAILKYGVNEENYFIIEFSNDEHTDLEIIKELLINSKPDGILSSVEKLAITTYHACQELNINIPKDVKIISYSNLVTASLLSPPLSTISQPAFEIGAEVCQALIRKIEGKSFLYDDMVILSSELIERESSS